MKEGLKCFLEIAPGSWFQFMSLDFGKNTRWTESSFVLIDGKFAPYQPPLLFGSLPTINFAWLANQNIAFNLGQIRTFTGIFIFAADSEVELYYRYPEMNGLDQFFG